MIPQPVTVIYATEAESPTLAECLGQLLSNLPLETGKEPA